MRADQKNEVLFLYIGYFVTLAFGLIPSISYYAIGALVLQAFYALIRYMSAHDPVFKSHLHSYLLGVGVSFAVILILAIQAQAFGFEIMKALTGAVSGTSYTYDSAIPFPYAAFLMVAEVLFAVFWPIILIARGLYLLNSGEPVFARFGKPAGVNVPRTAPFAGRDNVTERLKPSNGYMLSAILDGGQVVRFQLTGTSSKVIGRGAACDIVFEDPTVSRTHAIIETRDGQAFIKDLGSNNGTKVGGRSIGFNPVEIRPSETLQVGAVNVTISAL